MPQALFPAARDYLDSATIGLPPATAMDELEAAVEQWRRGEASAPGYDAWVDRSRAAFARLVGVPEQLVAIVEGSMSAPVYELLKRPDELFVVEHAHLQPRFVEDSVRLAIKGALEGYPELADDDFLFSRQVNLETIHTHDVVAERYGTVEELRGELAGTAPAAHTTLADWLAR